jgi:hypothetical protein
MREFRWQTSATAVQNLVPPTGEYLGPIPLPNLTEHQLVLPNVASRNFCSLFPIRLRSFLVMRTTERMYIGKVIDNFKKGSSAAVTVQKNYIGDPGALVAGIFTAANDGIRF